ncbi:MAG: GtrA family protein [Alteraurantiacibacter sp.]
MNRLRALTSPGEARAVLRFALVGLANTLLYLALCFALDGLTTLPSTVINTAAMSIGLVASYLGHARFTYRGSQAHRQGGPRFVAATAAIFASAAAVQWLAVHSGMPPRLSYLLVALWYPAASFAVHHFWTFRRGRA